MLSTSTPAAAVRAPTRHVRRRKRRPPSQPPGQESRRRALRVVRRTQRQRDGSRSTVGSSFVSRGHRTDAVRHVGNRRETSGRETGARLTRRLVACALPLGSSQCPAHCQLNTGSRRVGRRTWITPSLPCLPTGGSDVSVGRRLGSPVTEPPRWRSAAWRGLRWARAWSQNDLRLHGSEAQSAQHVWREAWGQPNSSRMAE
jgi:hypothetical protein